ncbi:MAG: hypothetical protein II799_07545 [Lachnospiraceae bacterium]|nr:hypothetical protein [Lachnospiraceae bacterium]
MATIRDRFLSEMCDALSTDRKLTSCDRDMQFFIEMQKKRVRDKGLWLDYDFTRGGTDSRGKEMPNVWEDGYYFAKMWMGSASYRLVLKKDGKVIYKKRKNVNVPIIVMDAIKGAPIGDDIYVCPNCAHPAKIKDLTQGCPYCDTKFKMDELYPKVTNFNMVRDYSDVLWDLVPWLIFGILAGVVAAVTLVVVMVCWLASGHQASDMAVAMFMSAARLVVALPFIIVFGVFMVGFAVEMIKTVILLVTFSSHKYFETEMKKYGQEYMSHFFMSKLVSKLKTVIFCDEPQELPFYSGGPLPAEMKDIVDIFFRGAVDYKKVFLEGNIAHVDADVYTEIVSEKNGRAKKRERIFHVRMMKNVDRPLKMTFSVTKFMCEGCGASFDATKNKHCPFCGSAYKVENEDWVIESIA